MLPAVLAVFPGLIAGFAGARDGVGAPCHLAGVEVGRLDIAADPEFAARRAHDRKVPDDQRCQGERLAQRWLGDLALPHDFTGCLVDGEHASVERDGDHLVLPQCDAAVVDAAASDIARPGAVGAGIHLPFDDALFSGGKVDRIDRAPAVRHVHDSVLDDRGRLQIAEGIATAALETAQRHGINEAHVLDAGGVDLFEQREAVALVVAVMQDPVLRLALWVEHALIGDIGSAHRRECCRDQQ
jgi:hypothetical protein